MRKLILSVALAGAAMAAVPAAAQDYRGYQDDRGYSAQRLQQLDYRIERGIERGLISNRDAYRLRSDLRDLHQLDRRFRLDGLSRWEREELDRRAVSLGQRVRYARQDGRDRDSGNRYDDRDTRYDRD